MSEHVSGIECCEAFGLVKAWCWQVLLDVRASLDILSIVSMRLIMKRRISCALYFGLL